MRLTSTAFAAVFALAAIGPAPVSAVDGVVAHSSEPPGRLARTGGVVELRAPRSTMILLPASTFEMGSTADDIVSAVVDCMKEPFGHRCEESMFSDEMPTRTVKLGAFWLDRTEVTVEEYRRCVALRRCRPPRFEQGGQRFDRPTFPVSMVTWKDASDFCGYRGARLPTEAEFERAARGRSRRRYPWGNLYNSRASNHGRYGWNNVDASDGFAELAPVGSFPSGRTPEGFLDLAGNVSEWVFDRYLPRYVPEDVDNPIGPEPPVAGSTRVVRGGGFHSGTPWLRGAARDGADPDVRRPFLGFRCSRPARSPMP